MKRKVWMKCFLGRRTAYLAHARASKKKETGEKTAKGKWYVMGL